MDRRKLLAAKIAPACAAVLMAFMLDQQFHDANSQPVATGTSLFAYVGSFTTREARDGLVQPAR